MTMTKDELDQWRKGCVEVYRDTTYEFDQDISVVHCIYRDQEGQLYQVDWYDGGWNRILPTESGGFTPKRVEAVVTEHKVKLTQYRAVSIDETPYCPVEQEEWHET